MRAACFKRSRGLSLAELMVATAIISLISVAAFQILAEGSKYLTANQKAIDAQRSGLAIRSGLGAGLQATKPSLISTAPEGVVFASPFTSSGSVEFDLSNQKLLWQKWVCYYLAGQEITRRELDIIPPTSSPGTPPVPGAFASVPVAKVLGKDIARFVVSQLSSTPPVWSIELTAGSMTNTSPYGIELRSEAGPRN